MKAYVNGRIVDDGTVVHGTVVHGAGDAGAPSLPLRDRGLLYGDGLFETMRVRRGRVEFLAEHLNRIVRSAEALAFPPIPETKGLAAAVREVVRANAGTDLALRLTITRGAGGTRLDIHGCDSPSVVVTASAYEDEELRPRIEGLRLATAPYPRNERSILSRHKTLNCLEAVLARAHARRQGADEAILRNTAGRIAEAAAANVFLVLGDVLVTPPIEEGALPGITRAAVIRAATAMGLQVQERGVGPEEPFATSEVFLTNSLLGLAAAAVIDGRRLPDPRGSAWIPRLRIRLREMAAAAGEQDSEDL